MLYHVARLGEQIVDMCTLEALSFFYFFGTSNVAATLQVGQPKEEPKLPVSLWGFTENAEVWNSRAAMIGIFGIVIVEAVSTCTNLQNHFTVIHFIIHSIPIE